VGVLQVEQEGQSPLEINDPVTFELGAAFVPTLKRACVDVGYSFLYQYVEAALTEHLDSGRPLPGDSTPLGPSTPLRLYMKPEVIERVERAAAAAELSVSQFAEAVLRSRAGRDAVVTEGAR
jgi:hypothetical protein